MTKLTITNEAREAAASCYNKMTLECPGSLYALRHDEGVRLTCLRLIEECVQLAINSAVKEWVKQCGEHAHFRKQVRHALECDGSDLPQIINKIEQLTQLRKVADELADKYRSEMIMMFGHAADCDCSRCTPYRTYNNFIKEGK